MGIGAKEGHRFECQGVSFRSPSATWTVRVHHYVDIVRYVSGIVVGISGMARDGLVRENRTAEHPPWRDYADSILSRVQIGVTEGDQACRRVYPGHVYIVSADACPVARWVHPFVEPQQQDHVLAVHHLLGHPFEGGRDHQGDDVVIP